LERTANEILALGTTDAAMALSTDVRSDSSVRSLARDSIKAMGRIDILVNAAGVLLQGKLDRITSADWTWMLETNLLGAVRTVNAFLPHMQEQGSGHIINTIPFGGIVPSDPFTISYDGGYAALVVYTRGLARELEGSGLHVSLYCLGSRGPRIGQNTRSRGMGRWFRQAEPLDERAPVSEHTADSLIEALHRPEILILADPADSEPARKAWALLSAAGGA
jgi:NAD(P)-dependent dehydrogenase (short-subunit alcohol dehydrogenase family)